MEDLAFQEECLYQLDILIDPKHSAKCHENFRGRFIFHDTITNLVIFQEEENESPSKVKSPPGEATSSSPKTAIIPSLRLIKGDCIANCKPCPVIHMNKEKKEWDSYRSRKANSEGEPHVDDYMNGQKIFNILSESFGTDTIWQGTDIVVKNQVRVSRPYLPENVTQEFPTLLEEVKQRLKLEEEIPQSLGPGK